MGKKIISPAELKAQYAHMPVMIALDPSIAELVAEELYRGKVVSDAYLVCDAIFSLPIDGLIALANIKNKKRILWGNGDRLLSDKSVLEFLGLNIAYIIDDKNSGGVVKSPYDLCYENPDEVAVLVEQTCIASSKQILENAGINKLILLNERGTIERKSGYVYLDPNLGHNIHSRGESSIISLQTSKNEAAKTIGVLGGSTSDIDYSQEISWPEQLMDIAEKQQKEINVLGGGTVSYRVSQEIVKFLRDMSFKKMHILISYSGYNDSFYSGYNDSFYSGYNDDSRIFSHNFVSSYQARLFSELAVSGQAQNKEFSTIRATIEMPLGIADIAEHWFHYEHMLYALCKELGIKFYAIFQPNLTTKTQLSHEEWFIHSLTDQLLLERIKKNTECIRSLVRKKMLLYPWLHDFSDIFAGCSKTVYMDDCHLNSYGNRILAEKIYALIADEL